jgi:hypothetical protein
VSASPRNDDAFDKKDLPGNKAGRLPGKQLSSAQIQQKEATLIDFTFKFLEVLL